MTDRFYSPDQAAVTWGISNQTGRIATSAPSEGTGLTLCNHFCIHPATATMKVAFPKHFCCYQASQKPCPDPAWPAGILTVPLLWGPRWPRCHAAPHVHLRDGPGGHGGRSPWGRWDGTVSFGYHPRGRRERPREIFEGKTFYSLVLCVVIRGNEEGSQGPLGPQAIASITQCVKVLNTAGNQLHEGVSKSLPPGKSPSSAKEHDQTCQFQWLGFSG